MREGDLIEFKTNRKDHYGLFRKTNKDDYGTCNWCNFIEQGVMNNRLQYVRSEDSLSIELMLPKEFMNA